MATELSDWFFHSWDLSSYPMQREIQDGGEVVPATDLGHVLAVIYMHIVCKVRTVG